jgi:uncharacterized membrane protein YeaQ/YmgE (transglycosylase-associated protein family)
MKKGGLPKSTRPGFLQRFYDLEKNHQFIFAFIVGVGIISFWRGVWELQNFFLFPQNPLFSTIASILGGMLLLFITHFFIKVFTSK